MKVTKQLVDFTESQLTFIVEPDDVGREFTVEASMIRYAAGGGSMASIRFEGGEDIKVAFKMERVEVPCNFCEGQGQWRSTRTAGFFRKRQLLELFSCSTCQGTGKVMRSKQVPLSEGRTT